LPANRLEALYARDGLQLARSTIVAPERHVLFRFSPAHDSAAVDRLRKGYTGYLVADAHAVYDHLYATGAPTAASRAGLVVRLTAPPMAARSARTARRRRLRIQAWVLHHVSGLLASALAPATVRNPPITPI